MLTVILSNAQIGAMHNKDNEDQRTLHENIIEASERAKDLTMKLLTFAKKEKINVQNWSAESILNDLQAFLKRSLPKSLRITLRVVQDSPVSVDKSQLYQALLNICSNAADAMPAGGDLEITCDRIGITEQQEPVPAALEPGAYCRISISDTGGGIPEKILPKIFEPFFTTKGMEKGTGLGLSVTHGIITGHGGCVTVDSELERGSAFHIFLPQAPEDQALEDDPSEQHVVPGRGETILVVDDEKRVLETTSRLLLQLGYHAMPAGSGPEAVALYEREHERIDGVLLDLVMPEMDGIAVAQSLKRINDKVKIIFYTGYGKEEQMRQIASTGVKHILQKPFASGDLSRLLNQLIHSPDSSY